MFAIHEERDGEGRTWLFPSAFIRVESMWQTVSASELLDMTERLEKGYSSESQLAVLSGWEGHRLFAVNQASPSNHF